MKPVMKSVPVKKIYVNKSNGQLLIYLPKKKIKTIPEHGKFVWMERRQHGNNS